MNFHDLAALCAIHARGALTSMNNLAHKFYVQDCKEEAIRLIEHVLKSLKAAIEANHPNTLEASI
jgi:hypothetical protein